MGHDSGMPGRAVIWDFDGTLAYRSGHWPDCLVEILDAELPGHGHGREAFAAAMQRGFRWHDWHAEHPVATDARQWWQPVEAIAAGAYREAGYPDTEARRLAARLREVYLRRGAWSLFDDARAALALTASAGWRNAILSNHVPELADLVADLGLADLLDALFNSALIGFEKPHPRAFRGALDGLGAPDQVWMVGDQLRADVEGAEAVGIPAILVRTDAPAARRSASALEAARAIVAGGTHSWTPERAPDAAR